MSPKPHSAEEPARVGANQVFGQRSRDCSLIGSRTFYGLHQANDLDFIVGYAGAIPAVSHDEFLCCTRSKLLYGRAVVYDLCSILSSYRS